MKIMITALVASLLAMSGCTTTTTQETTTTIETATADETVTLTYLTSHEIRSQILDQTLSGDASFPKIGQVPFQMYFGGNPPIYKELSVIQGKLAPAIGSNRVTDTASLCRKSPDRREGVETCWIIAAVEGGYRMEEIGGRQYKFNVTAEPGLNF